MKLRLILQTIIVRVEKELNSTFKDYYGVDAKSIIKDDILYKNVKNYLIKNVKEA